MFAAAAGAAMLLCGLGTVLRRRRAQRATILQFIARVVVVGVCLAMLKFIVLPLSGLQYWAVERAVTAGWLTPEPDLDPQGLRVRT